MRRKSIDELAVFGGEPLFPESIHVGRPFISNRSAFMRRVDAILDSKRLTNDGPYVNEFERRIATVTGAQHVVAVCSGTAALEISARALGLTGEVIVPSFTFIASAHCFSWLGLTPVFCDIRADHGIDVAHAESLITDRTSAILGVNIWGNACDIDGLMDLKRRFDLKILLDSAHAFGGTFRGTPFGSFGDVEIFSFHATKFVHSFEGGAICTRNDRLAEKVRGMRNFGFSGFDRVSDLGTNGKMSEISAAMGITSIEEMDAVAAVNRRRYATYERCLAAVPNVRLLAYAASEKNSFQHVVVEIETSALPLTRNQIHDILWTENVSVRRYFWPGCHRMPVYAAGHADLCLPRTEKISESVLILPTGPNVTEDDVEHICELLATTVKEGEAIAARLEKSKATRDAH